MVYSIYPWLLGPQGLLGPSRRRSDDAGDTDNESLLFFFLKISCTPAHTRAHPHTPAHTRAYPRTPHTYPLMPADALNLINHMKLHVNGKMADR